MLPLSWCRQFPFGDSGSSGRSGGGLEKNVPERLTIFALTENHRHRLRTSNPVERALQQELKRRTIKMRALSYGFSGSRATREPLPGTLNMPVSGGGWIVKGLVFEDREWEKNRA
jgi:hypothetical protein